jgi:predicted transcriptional regulator
MSDTNTVDETKFDTIRLAAEVVSAYVGFNTVASSEIPALIASVHESFSHLGAEPAAPAAEAQKPAVPIGRSIREDHLVCLEDGKKLKMLKRYLRTRFDMTPEEYRRKWGLPADYPMVAPSYSRQRSSFATQIGLGKRRG